jgi:hypothetical protein
MGGGIAPHSLMTMGNKKISQARPNFFFLIHILYDPFIHILFAKNCFSKILSINCDRDGFMFILISLRLSGIEFSLVSD